MHFLVLSVICSVLVSVLLKLAPRRGVDIAQAVTWNYLAASVLSLLLLKPSLQSLQSGHTPWLALLGLAVALPGIFLVLARAVREAGIVRRDSRWPLPSCCLANRPMAGSWLDWGWACWRLSA